MYKSLFPPSPSISQPSSISHGSKDCVTRRGRSYPFYSQGPCLNNLSPLHVVLTCYLYSRHSKIVLVAIQDEGSAYMSPAIDALKRLGATDPVQPDERGSFALAGYAGVNKPQWITQERADSGLGPSEIFPQIALSVNY